MSEELSSLADSMNKIGSNLAECADKIKSNLAEQERLFNHYGKMKFWHGFFLGAGITAIASAIAHQTYDVLRKNYYQKQEIHSQESDSLINKTIER